MNDYTQNLENINQTLDAIAFELARANDHKRVEYSGKYNTDLDEEAKRLNQLKNN
jgi:hypothetical protein